ncbi:MAG: trans-aconitate 2-methyltransferase [Marinicellaceae bacterium]
MNFHFKNLFKKNTKQQKYEDRINNEINFYKDCENVHDLPEIFHYWSNKYLLPLHKQFGFNSPDDFFIIYCQKFCTKHASQKHVKILSVGSGNGELEVKVASELKNKGITNFSITCMDINKHMLDRTINLAKKENVEQHIKILIEDFNKWKPSFEYDIILANQSLHHVLELEHLFNSIYNGLSKNGQFLTSDMIGRNGHMRWPEALEALQPFWQELAQEKKYNQLLKRQEDTYINHDCSTEGFEGIRAQDILPLLKQKFNFELFIPFANIVSVVIDRPFGHNFDTNDTKDLNFIDRLQAKDEELILKGVLKPTQMIAAMTKSQVLETKLVNPILTPEFCIRKV